MRGFRLTGFSHFLSRLNTIPLELKAVARNVEALQQSRVDYTPKSKLKFLSGIHILSNEWIPAWFPIPLQIDFTSTTFEDARKTRHHETSIRLRFPNFGKFSRLMINLALRPSFVLWTPLEFPGITLKNEISEDSEICVACKTGNSLKVWELLKTGRGSHKDVTPDNSSPLRVSELCHH